MDQRTSLRAMEILTTPIERKKRGLNKAEGSIMLFKIFFHNLLWNKVGFIFYYGYRGFGDRPKSASFSYFSLLTGVNIINLGLYASSRE